MTCPPSANARKIVKVRDEDDARVKKLTVYYYVLLYAQMVRTVQLTRNTYFRLVGLVVHSHAHPKWMAGNRQRRQINFSFLSFLVSLDTSTRHIVLASRVRAILFAPSYFGVNKYGITVYRTLALELRIL